MTSSIFLLIFSYYFFSYVFVKKFRVSRDSQENVIDLENYRKQKHQKEKTPVKVAQKATNWVTVIDSCDQSRISLAESLLSSHQIESRVNNRFSASIFPAIEGLNMILMVRESQLSAALEVLKKYEIDTDDFKNGLN
ncbi:MAG: DUF2007 domain-containing protein [Deltaproteobacteria bacterium]|nr:DUF2007 domain-containing protein [Deltaproteobacteria bacterium]